MFSFLISLLFGVSVAIIVWLVYQIFATIPEEDRRYLDELPSGFKMTWPIVKLLVYYFGPRLSQNYRLATHIRMRKAGADYALSPEQFFAGKVIASVVGLLFGLLMTAMLEQDALGISIVTTLIGFFYPDIWLRELTQTRMRQIFRALPFFLDIITLCVESGSNLAGGLRQAVEKGPEGPLKVEVNRMLREMRAGKSRADALRSFADRLEMPPVNSLVSSLIQAEKMGSNLAPVLRTNSEQRRIERFQKAEKLAMEAPVKLLGPLVMFIFPNTFIILMFVLMVKAVHENVITWAPLVAGLSWPG